MLGAMNSIAVRQTLARTSWGAWYPVRMLAVVIWAAGALVLAMWSTEGFIWWSGLGLAIAAFWPFVRAWRRGLDPAEVLWCFLLYFVLAMLLRGVGVLTFVDSRYLRSLGDAQSPAFRQLVGWAFFYSTLGLVALNAAYHAQGADHWARKGLLRHGMLSSPWRSSRIIPVGLGMIAVGGVGILLRVRSMGGLFAAAMNPGQAGIEGAVGHYWQVALTEFAVVGFHVLVIGAMLRGDRRLPWIWLGLGLLLGAPLYIISSSKSILIRVLFTPMLFWHFLRKPLRLGHILGFFGGFVLLFPLFYAYRSLGLAGLDGLENYIDRIDVPLLLFYHRSYGVDSFMRVLHATGQGLVPLQWGRSFQDLFVFAIPRAWWPAKPESFGLVFPALYMPDVEWGSITFVTPSLPGELFLNFHVLGVCAGFLVLGWGMRAAFALARHGGPGAILLYAYFFLEAAHVVEGGIATQIEFFLTNAIPAVIAIALLRARTGAVAPNPEAP